jgi:hypothetical protein
VHNVILYSPSRRNKRDQLKDGFESSVIKVCLGVESEYYSNTLRELRSLTLWDKIWKNLKKLNKIWFIFEKSKILFNFLYELDLLVLLIQPISLSVIYQHVAEIESICPIPPI